MKTILSIGRQFTKATLLAAGLLVVANPAFALAISNNAGAELNYSFKCPSKTFAGEAPAGQQKDVCALGEEGCSGTCSYSIEAAENKSCSGDINALSGLQVDKGLKCVSF